MTMLLKWMIRVFLLAIVSAVAFASHMLAQSPELLVAEGVTKILPGYQFNKRLSGPTEEDHILLFSKGPDCALVTWTTGDAKTFDIPASPMGFTVYNTAGQALSTLLAQNFNLSLVLAKEPAIYVPQDQNALLQVAILAQRLPQKITIRGPQIIDIECEFVNPMNKPLILSTPGASSVAVKPGSRHIVRQQVKVGRFAEPMKVRVGASGIYQTVLIESENPIFLDVQADQPGRLTVNILNPMADPFSGRIAMKLVGNDRPPFEFPVEMVARERVKELAIPLGIELPLPFPVELVLTQPVGNPREDVVLAMTAPTQFVPVRGLAPGADQKPTDWRLQIAGNSFADLRAGAPPKGAPWNAQTAMLAYKFDAPGDAMQLSPSSKEAAQITELPAEVGMWIHGDRSGNRVSVRWKDATGKVFQPKPREVTWSGWRYETFATDSSMQLPIAWDSVIYVEAASPTTGAIMISGPVLTYQARTQQQQESDRRSVEVKDDISYGMPVDASGKPLGLPTGVPDAAPRR